MRSGDIVNQFINEISELKKQKALIKTELSKYKKIFRHTRIGVMISSTDGKALDMVNEAFAEMHGYNVEELAGKPIAEVFASCSQADLPNQIKTLHKKGSHAFEASHIHRDGTIFPVKVEAAIVKDEYGSVLYHIASVRDINGAKLNESKLRTDHQQLMDIIEFLPDATFVIDQDKKVIAWNRIEEMIGVIKELFLDITWRKEAELALGESEQRLRLVTDNMLDMVLVASPEGILEYVSPSIKSIMGYEHDSMVLLSMLDLVHPMDVSRVAKILEDSIKNMTQVLVEHRCKHADGYYLWLESVGKPVPDAKGKVKAYIIASRDITDRKRAENYLKDERRRLYSLLDGLPTFVYLQNPDYSIGYYNQTFLKLFGDPSGRPCFEVLSGVDKPCGNCPTFRVFETNSPEVWEWNSRDGKTYQVYDYPFSDLNGTPLVLGLGINITERKQAEKELAYRARFEKLISDITTNFINIAKDELDSGISYALRALGEFAGVDRIGLFQFCNNLSNLDCTHQWCADGMKPQSAVLKGIEANDYSWWMEKLRRLENIYIPRVADLPDEASSERALLQAQYVQSVAVLPLVYGEDLMGCLWLESVREAKAWSDEVIALLKIVGETLVNVLQREKAEDALRLSEERFSKAFEASPCAMSIHRMADEKIIDVNTSFLINSGYRKEEVIGVTPHELQFWAEYGDCSKIMKMSRQQGMIINYEIKYYNKLGEERIGLLSADMIRLNNEPCMLVAIIDITELRLYEREAARLDRLNLIGQMAAGIGHEIRNPMTTVRGFLQLLGGKEEQKKYIRYYDLMISELDRANKIITEYLSLAKNKAIKLQPGNLNTVIESIDPLISADALMHDKNTVFELEDLSDILIDPEDIRKLILNLARNGLEAMSKGGNLTISTYQEGGEVVLAVKDQGNGIKAELLDRIGTPFFTTKDTGTGLGLAICNSVADRHGATIGINTSPEGTTFTVRFKPLG